MHICSRVSHSICANFAQFFGTWKIQLIVCCGFPCECTFSMLYLFISALRNAHWLSIYRAYTRTHTHTPETIRYDFIWFDFYIQLYIWYDDFTSEEASETFFGLSDNRQQNQLKRKTTTSRRRLKKERGATVDCVRVCVCFLLLFTLTSYWFHFYLLFFLF